MGTKIIVFVEFLKMTGGSDDRSSDKQPYINTASIKDPTKYMSPKISDTRPTSIMSGTITYWHT